MKFLLSLTLASVIGSSVTATAQAHFLYHKKHMTLKERVDYFKHSIWHDRTALKWLKATRSNFRVISADQTEIDRKDNLRVVVQQLRWHEQALRWHRSLLKFYGEKLRAEWLRAHSRLPTYSGLPPHYTQWLCIHRYEGAWNDPGEPYFGGLQMDDSFMAAYGGNLLRTKGTADHWTPLEQMWVAERGLAVQGWYAWPNTARFCGLI